MIAKKRFGFRMHHLIMLVVVLGVAVMYSKNVGGRLNNELQDNPVTEEAHRLFVSKYYSLTTCDGQDFKSYGILSNDDRCVSTIDCKDFWPAGPSFEARDRSVCCLEGPAAGECGEII